MTENLKNFAKFLGTKQGLVLFLGVNSCQSPTPTGHGPCSHRQAPRPGPAVTSRLAPTVLSRTSPFFLTKPTTHQAPPLPGPRRPVPSRKIRDAQVVARPRARLRRTARRAHGGRAAAGDGARARAAAAPVRAGRSVQGGPVRRPALRRERVDGLGPRAGRQVRPRHGRRPRRREPRSLPAHADACFPFQLFPPEELKRNSSVVASSVSAAAAESMHRQSDFVVYLGDLVTANNLPIPNASLYWDRAISASRSRGVPWATVFGNHDDMPFEWPPEWFSPDGVPPLRCPASPPPSTPDSGCSFRGTPRTDLMAAETGANSRLSYSSSGPRELWPGVSNYVLQVLSRRRRTRAGDDHDPALLMYFLDSGGGSYTEVVSSAQVKWFHSQSQFLNPNGRLDRNGCQQQCFFILKLLEHLQESF